MPHCGASIEYPQGMFSWRNKKNIFLIAPLTQNYESENRVLLKPVLEGIGKTSDAKQDATHEHSSKSAIFAFFYT